MTSTAAVAAEWPADGLETVDGCPACGASGRSILHADLTDRSYLCAPGRWDLHRCEDCGAAYLDPRPDARSLHLAFASFYDSPSRPLDLAGPPASALRRLRRSLRNGYLASRYGYDLRPRSSLGRLVLPLLPRHREQADELVRHLPRPGHPSTLLDVGCGEGEFIAAMARLGWATEGVEPSPEAAAIARSRGARVTVGSLPEVRLATEAYDAVTFRLVLEYLRDPAAGLTACRDALKPGGVLWVASPNIDSTAHRFFGRDWIFLETPRHAVIFSVESLARLVTSLGFDVVTLEPSRQARWSFRLSNAIRLGRPPFRDPPRLAPRLSLRARLADAAALRNLDHADVFVLVARKR